MDKIGTLAAARGLRGAEIMVEGLLLVGVIVVGNAVGIIGVEIPPLVLRVASVAPAAAPPWTNHAGEFNNSIIAAAAAETSAD